MIDQERAGQPAADAEDRERPCASSLDPGCGASFDYIDEDLEDSMIASDPAAWAPPTGMGAPGQTESPALRD